MTTKHTTSWRNRIVGHGTEAPDRLLANPVNWRVHPKSQQDALAKVLNRVGWVQDVIVNQQTGHVVDGHLRVALAISNKEDVIPVVYVDLTEDEEKLVLASLDTLSHMAVTDEDMLAALLNEIKAGDESLAELVAGLGAEMDVILEPDNADWSEAFGGVPDGDRAPFQQMTFTLHDTQAEIVQQAIKAAIKAGGFATSPNANSNGNAIARICEAYLNG